MGIEAARHSRKEGSNHKGRHFYAGRVDPHRGGRDLIVAHSLKTTPVGRSDQCNHRVNRQHGEADSPEKIGRGENPLHTASPADKIGILKEHADDLAKTKRHHRQVVAAESQGGPPHNEPCKRGHDTTNQKHREKKQLGGPRGSGPGEVRQKCRKSLPRKKRGGIRTDGHESCMAKRELPRLPHHQIKADSKDHVDRSKKDHLRRVGIDQTARELEERRDTNPRRKREARVADQSLGGMEHG